MTTTDEPILSRLGPAFQGEVVSPDDGTYDEARSLFYGGYDRRPTAVVRPETAQAVASVVALARDAGLPLAVRSGGHSVAGLSVCDGGVVLDLRRMDGLEVDLEGRTAWAGAGLTALEYSTSLAEHGLATGFGDTGSVGLGGITLGGGVGYLSRKYGLTVDDLLAAEVVTADGAILHVDADHHPDLFWAIRGGGGNFGVATRFRFRLHEVPEVYGGMLMLPVDPDVVVSFLRLAAEAPDELSTILNLIPAPPMPFVPESAQGSIVGMALVCYAGPADEGERALAPFRALATPLADMVAAMPYPGLYPPEDPQYHPTAVARTMYVDEVDRDLAALVLERLEASDAPVRATQLRVLGGAISRVPAGETAYAHRSSKIMVNVAAFYESPDLKPVRMRWVEELGGQLLQSDHGAYVNFITDAGPEAARAAYPGATWDRLVAVKRRYDPTNLFRLNVNVPPD